MHFPLNHPAQYIMQKRGFRSGEMYETVLKARHGGLDVARLKQILDRYEEILKLLR